MCTWSNRWVQGGGEIASALKPFLFTVVMDRMTDEVRQEIVICSESSEWVGERPERWRYVLERKGIKVSRSKTEDLCLNERKAAVTVKQ